MFGDFWLKKDAPSALTIWSPRSHWRRSNSLAVPPWHPNTLGRSRVSTKTTSSPIAGVMTILRQRVRLLWKHG